MLMMLFAIHTYTTHQNYFMMCIIARLNARLIAKRLFHLNEWFFAFYPLIHTHTHTLKSSNLLHIIHTNIVWHSNISTRTYHTFLQLQNIYLSIYGMRSPLRLPRISYSNCINESLLTVYQLFHCDIPVETVTWRGLCRFFGRHSIYRSKCQRTLVVKNQCESIFDWSICTCIAPPLIVFDCYRSMSMSSSNWTSRNFIMFM